MNSIKMKYKELFALNGNQMLIGKLFSTPLAKNKTTVKLKKLFDLLYAQSKIVRDLNESEIVEKFAKRDEAGAIVRPEGRPWDFDVAPENEEAFKAARIDFDEREFDLNRPKFALADLDGIRFTLSELQLLEPIVDLGDDEESVQGEEKAPTALRSV